MMHPLALSKALSVALVASLIALGFCAYKHLSGDRDIPESCQPSTFEQDVARRDEIKHNASPNVGGMGMYEYKVKEEAPPGFPAQTITAHPNVALWTPHGRLLGSDRGEFGGELVLSRNDNRSEPDPEIILRDNIEDLFVMPYGIVVTAGLAHMGYDKGAVYLLSFSGSQPTAKKIYDLPSSIVSSWQTKDQNILINTRSGSYLIKSPTEIISIRCPARNG
ncbi:MAG: hypothetical protein LCH70_02975 [Proteobacteria bacterium]|nr:hypothetical protein [Pseudomonadota bacterium]